jgi:hypothetical protein
MKSARYSLINSINDLEGYANVKDRRRERGEEVGQGESAGAVSIN